MIDLFREVQFIGKHLIAATKGGIPEIGLFTVISLAIALTGAAYSVILAFRDEYKAKIDSAIKNAPNLIKEVRRGNLPHETNYKKGEAAYKNFNKSIKNWKSYQLWPVIIFCFFVVAITIFVLLHKDPCDLQYPWWIFRITLSVVFVVDIISLLLVLKTTRKVKTYHDALLDAANIAREGRIKFLKTTRRAEQSQRQLHRQSGRQKKSSIEKQPEDVKKPVIEDTEKAKSEDQPEEDQPKQTKDN